MRTPILLCLPLFLTVVVALPPRSAAAPETAPAAAPAAGGKVVGPPEVAWKDLTADQKTKFMKAVVTPKMRKLFQEFDADKFKKVDCSTCHGKNAREVKFKMPNAAAEIAPLPPTPEAYKVAMEKKPTWPKWSQFMGEKVEPQMAALLGKPTFDPKKPDPAAFGCVACHTLDKK
jgi:cytochrome c553